MRKEVRLLTGMRFSEISLVDHPACDKATVTSVELVKRSDVEHEPELNHDALKEFKPDEASAIRKFFRFLLTPPKREDEEREEVLKRISDPEMRKRVELTMKGVEDVPPAQRPPGKKPEVGGDEVRSTPNDPPVVEGSTEDATDKASDKGPEKKTRAQVGLLLSDKSPLSDKEKKKLKDELHSGKVVVSDKAANSDDLKKREFSQEQRDDAADSGAAMPDGSFPIKNEGDLKNAIRAVGRASNPAKAKAHIKQRARALGRTDLLPDDWKSAAVDSLDKSLFDVTNFAQVVMGLDSIARMSEMSVESEEDPADDAFVTKLKALRDSAGALLVEMTQHEVGEFKMSSPEDIQKAALLVLDALNAGAEKKQQMEKAGAKFSAATMAGLTNCKRAMEKASGYFAKAGDRYPDDDDIDTGRAHLDKASGHLMKSISWSDGHSVSGKEPEDLTAGDAEKPYKASSAADLQKALTVALGPLQEQIGGLQAELKAARDENAGLRKQVEAIGGLPAPSRIRLGTGVAVNKGTADSAIATAAGAPAAPPELQINPDDHQRMSKAGIPMDLHKAITMARREPMMINGQPGSSAGAI